MLEVKVETGTLLSILCNCVWREMSVMRKVQYPFLVLNLLPPVSLAGISCFPSP